MPWYPSADKSIKGNSSGSYSGGPFRGVLHTTEGSNGSGSISAYKKNNSWPHFQVDPDGKVWQFVDTSQAARALRNLSGGVQTNRESAVQIEIVGFAGQPTNHSAAQWNVLRDLMRWIESTSGVKPKGPGRPFANAYGQNNLRFTNAEWDNFDGWCGHCHVPENTHWDPGAIDLASLLPTTPPNPNYSTEVFVPFTLPRSQGGYIVVGGDGGVFTYDGAPFHGSLPGVGVVTNSVKGAAWTPSGNGYWMVQADGAIFSFGDAQYKGGLNGTPHLGNRIVIGLVAKGNGYSIVAYDASGDGSWFDHYDFGV